jgi:hypothetical protein
MMRKIRILFLLVILLFIVSNSVAHAQMEQLVLKMSRDWGYGGFNGDIQGLFSMRVTGPADLLRVAFFIDEIKIGEVATSPYNLQFTTDNYSNGVHELYAIGYSQRGIEYRSNVITANFVPKQFTTKIILPVLGVILAAVLLSSLGPLLATRGKRISIPLGAERKYGAGGGGICPNCHRPFALPLLSAHLGFSKLAACPFCGKWNLVRVESITKLRGAEKAELDWEKPNHSSEISAEEELGKELDDSKYQGL